MKINTLAYFTTCDHDCGSFKIKPCNHTIFIHVFEKKLAGHAGIKSIAVMFCTEQQGCIAVFF